MFVKINGQGVETEAQTLWELKDSLYPKKDNLVLIVGGYQMKDDYALQGGEEITIIEKGKMPPREQLEQMMMARHTPGVHEKVRRSRVAVAGLGGLGSQIAMHLARIGVGHLHLLDFDMVEPSNLNRQQYGIRHLGQKKAIALQQEIAEINPYAAVTAQVIRVTAENIPVLFQQDDIICEAFDDPGAKSMLVNGVCEHYPDKPIVAASGMAGYGSSNEILTRRIGGNLYLCGDGETAAGIGSGLMAPRVAVCAGHQANMILRLILGHEQP